MRWEQEQKIRYRWCQVWHDPAHNGNFLTGRVYGNTSPHIDGSTPVRSADFWLVCRQQIATYGFADSENNQIAGATTKHSQALRNFYWPTGM
ncbi:hypothetical protein [Mesorhizobium sp. M1322]|uniref:hypothetical protein n=1 Tax=Mesorhizobium sp. M1322 TaxID=2957081 RepID=UPI003334F2CA